MELEKLWRVSEDKLHIYEEGRFVCQCHTVQDAEDIVFAVNEVRQQRNERLEWLKKVLS